MLDPLSVAGLALAVFEELLTLGERTAELVSTIRSFDEDIKDANEQVRHQIWKSNRLKGFLFSESTVYGGVTLIEKFDEDAQDQIHISLIELRSALQGALALLSPFTGSNQRDPATPPRVATPSTLLSRSPSMTATLPSYATAARLKSNKSPLTLLKWSLRDKNKVTLVVSHFTELNNRLLEKVQFLSLASAIGVEFHHLERLRQDEDSINLGFHDDASLKLTTEHTETVSESFELDPGWEAVLRDSQRVEDRFARFEWSGKRMLQEDCVYILGQEADIDPKTRNRINGLAQLLHRPKEKLFCILPCQGWRYLQDQKRISYIFELPPGVESSPKSLLLLLRDPKSQPSLNTRFSLAYSLARSIAQLHMVRWVHESFRSENILFFSNSGEADGLTPANSTPAGLNLRNPWIFGFEFSRRDTFFSAGYTDLSTDRDIYRHPERQGQPLRTFRKTDDIYALGVVLLEIGLWRPAKTLEPRQFAHAKAFEVRERFQRHTLTHIEPEMGENYKNVVLKCLSGAFGIEDDTPEDLKLQQAFRSQVVDVLKKITEAI